MTNSYELKSHEIPILANLRSQNSEIRLENTFAIRMIGPRAHEAIPYLIQNLHDSCFDVVGASIAALGAIGYRAESAIPQIIDMMNEENQVNKHIKSVFIEALTGLLPPMTTLNYDLVLNLSKALQHSEESIRIAAAFGLSKLSDSKKSALDSLINSLNDESQEVRYWVSACLREMRAEILARIDEVVLCASSNDENVATNLIDCISNVFVNDPFKKTYYLKKILPSNQFINKYIYSQIAE